MYDAKADWKDIPEGEHCYRASADEEDFVSQAVVWRSFASGEAY